VIEFLPKLVRRSVCLALALLGGALAGVADAQIPTKSFTIFAGSAYNLPTPLTVRQTGEPIIRFTAHYDTKPLGPNAPYYSWRLEFWNDAKDRAWEFRQVHHRLFLTNNPPEIQIFAIHYGYNFFMAGRAWRSGPIVLHLDAGVVVCAPENTVRGKVLAARKNTFLDAGYKLGGGGVEFSASHHLDFTKRIFATSNFGVMFGWARVPVVDGSADVPSVSLHGQVGIGIRF
jgi:hypothetical protein